MRLILIFLIYVLTLITWTNAKEISELSETFQTVIPQRFKDGLRLISIEDRCSGCAPWRYIDYYENNNPKPIKREKVSVKTGYRAMYAYPNTHYFANVKIEQSIPSNYGNDIKIIEDALKHECNRKGHHINSYLKTHQKLKTKIAPYRAKGKPYIEFEKNKLRGYSYIACTENVLGLTSNTISQIHIFVPDKTITITAYLLMQEKRRFKDIEEFIKLKQKFIAGYIDFLNNKQ